MLVSAINTAGRALSGWTNPAQAVHSPRLVFLDKQKQVGSFMDDLLSLHFNKRFGENEDLRPLVKTAFATLLMYLPNLKLQARGTFIFKQVEHWCQRHRMSLSQLEVSEL